jgi:general secretion pathway protein B
MSYILDALRRADAERERGAVPSLQSQQNTIVDDDATPARPRSLVWAVVALAIAVLALLAWNFLGGSAPPARAPIEGAISTPVPAPLPALQPAPTPPTAAVPAVTPAINAAAPTPTPTPTPALQPTPTAPPVAAAPPTARAAVDARRAPAAPAAPKRVGAATTGTPGAAPATAEPRVHSQAELPEDIRRDLPKLVIGGSSYSGDAASRMVMINGQVFHEGDRLAPDLVLERIRLKSAVLAFKGWRYEVLF